MSVFLPLLGFAVFFMIFAALGRDGGTLTRWRIAFLSASLTWGLAVTAVTESLSLFHLITAESLILVWSGVVLLAAVILRIASGKQRPLADFQFPRIPPFELCCLGAVAAIVAVVGVVALIAPPNNADSIFYHMARVVHWQQNQAVAHYPTNILHQLFLPPWSGFAILHFQILSGGDRWANVVQWFSMVGSLLGVSLLAKLLGAKLRGQVLAVVIAATLPMGVLQASSTQNDYVTAFWLVCSMYFLLRFKTTPTLAAAAAMGASVALALLTKPTAYMFALPMLLWFAAVALSRGGWKNWVAWRAFVVVGAILLSVNAGHFVRNLELWGNPLGFDQNDAHPNRVYGASVMFSNAIRGLSIHVGTRSLQINEVIRENIQKAHAYLGIDASDPRTTFSGDFYQNWFSHHEDRAGNPIHLMLAFASLGMGLPLYKRASGENLLPYVLILAAGFLAHCYFVKWSVWHSRPHLPLFVLVSPMIVAVLQKKSGYPVVCLISAILTVAAMLYMSGYAILLLTAALVLSLWFQWQVWRRTPDVVAFLVAGTLLSASTLYVFRNQTRPLIGIVDHQTILNTSRTDQFFTFHPYRGLRKAYFEVARFVTRQNCRHVGLVMDSYGREYPFWAIFRDIERANVRIEHVNVDNVSAAKNGAQPFAGFHPCAVVVVDTDRYTAPRPDAEAYLPAFSSGPLSVFTLRESRS